MSGQPVELAVSRESPATLANQDGGSYCQGLFDPIRAETG
jgi:hypothetical protein